MWFRYLLLFLLAQKEQVYLLLKLLVVKYYNTYLYKEYLFTY